MFFYDKDIELGRVDDNTLRKVLSYGDGLMNTLVVFEKGLAPDSVIPYHKHVHVQTTYVLKGSFKFSIKYPDHTDTNEVHVGDTIYFPSNLEHGCIPLEDDSRLIDSFNPIREDFL
ncbi:cupin domain-containing protein [Companilactobacillus baiquanensis]|uniref:Cupin domain-containing protein n=1 Tax=Companilactobacillus baiquanensis TaxID=2486005 RepID=A0ABW1UTF2_9LACO|nr:cupin domain-containing protein [Companilactobacillus baiquanensis]